MYEITGEEPFVSSSLSGSRRRQMLDIVFEEAIHPVISIDSLHSHDLSPFEVMCFGVLCCLLELLEALVSLLLHAFLCVIYLVKHVDTWLPHFIHCTFEAIITILLDLLLHLWLNLLHHHWLDTLNHHSSIHASKIY